MVNVKSPLNAVDAKKLLRKILDFGEVTHAQPHALQRLSERSISMMDCENVLRTGKIEPDGVNRFRVSTNKITVVIELISENEVLVVTVWR